MSKITVCYCADANVLDLLDMSAKSVLKFNPDAEIIVVSKNPLNVPYKNILLDTDGYTFPCPKGERLTEATYYRLFLPTLGFDRCLYLDCDTLCAGDLSPLWEMDIPYIGICSTHNSGVSQSKMLHIPRYACDAMMLMNCQNLRKIHYTDTMMRVLPNLHFPAKRFHFAETLLNAVYWDRLTFVSMKWNKCKNRSYSSYQDEVCFKDAVIRHYIGGQKAAQISDYKQLMR